MLHCEAARKKIFGVDGAANYRLRHNRLKVPIPRRIGGLGRMLFASQQAVATSGKVRVVAGVTGLEPAASGVTGRRSNQLSYTPVAKGFRLRFSPPPVKEDGRQPALPRLRVAPAIDQRPWHRQIIL
jgi:hypothetical protein